MILSKAASFAIGTVDELVAEDVSGMNRVTVIADDPPKTSSSFAG